MEWKYVLSVSYLSRNLLLKLPQNKQENYMVTMFSDAQEISYRCPFIVYKKLSYWPQTGRSDEVENIA